MRKSALFVIVLAAACGGGKSKATVTTTTPPPTDKGEDVEPTDDEGSENTGTETPPAPPPPQEWHAKADLAPVKGSKMKPATVTFSQTDGEKTSVSSDAAFDGLKPGTYHLVIHDGADCAKNATKVGAAWPDATSGAFDVTVAKGTPGSLDAHDLDLALDGDKTIVGHTLVLHADKKGKAGKAMACGAIVTVEDGDAAASQPSDDQ